jgi:HEPN domain-containing protein
VGFNGESSPTWGDPDLSRLIETRAEFQELAEQRVVEAKSLLDLGMWDGAFYLTGYAVELALKSCIIKMLMTTDAFPDRDFLKNCYTHDIESLVRSARLVDIR